MPEPPFTRQGPLVRSQYGPPAFETATQVSWPFSFGPPNGRVHLPLAGVRGMALGDIASGDHSLAAYTPRRSREPFAIGRHRRHLRHAGLSRPKRTHAAGLDQLPRRHAFGRRLHTVPDGRELGLCAGGLEIPA